MKVKICGITNVRDAQMAVCAGADAIGVIVDVPVETPRKISIETAREIRQSLFGKTRAFVAVIMPKTVDEAVSVAKTLSPDAIQLHGNESPGFVKEVSDAVDCLIIKALHIGGILDMDYVLEVSNVSDLLLLDTKSFGLVGGTGKTHDYDADIIIREASKRRIILAGGLNPNNLRHAVDIVRPYAVDASSGVESAPGKKDPRLLREFLEVASCL